MKGVLRHALLAGIAFALGLGLLSCGKKEPPQSAPPPTTVPAPPTMTEITPPPKPSPPVIAAPVEDPDEVAALALYQRWEEATQITVSMAESKKIRSGDETLRFQKTLDQIEGMKQRMSVVTEDVKKHSPRVQELFWQAVGWSGRGVENPIISADGARVAFEYSGIAFDSTAQDKGKLIYLWNLTDGSVQRVVPDSVIGTRSSFGRAALSSDGAIVAFERLGNVAGTPKGMWCVALYDVAAAKLTWAVGDAPLFPQTPWAIHNDIVRVVQHPSLSADGQKLAFLAGQVASRETDENVETFFIVTVLDRKIGGYRALSGKAWTLVSPILSGDGSTIAVAGPPSAFEAGSKDNTSRALYLISVGTGKTTRVPLPAGVEFWSDPNTRFALSSNGDRVAFVARHGKQRQVYLFDRAANSTVLVSATPQQQPANAESYEPAISGDGNTIVFVSNATDLLGATPTRGPQLYRHDILSGTISLITKTSDGLPATGAVSHPSLNTDGSVVAFLCNAHDLAGIRSSRLNKAGSAQMRLFVGRLRENRFVLVGSRL